MGGGGMSQAEIPQAFRTATEAVAWLRKQGWKVSPQLFSNHWRAGKIPRSENGFESSALLGYAATNLRPLASASDAEAREAAIGKLSADGQLKAIRAERERLKLEKDRGLLMPVARHEAELAARAVFFRAEVESFIVSHAGEMISLVHGDESLREELVAWWEEATAAWLDAYARDREFLLPGEDEDAVDAPAEEEGGDEAL